MSVIEFNRVRREPASPQVQSFTAQEWNAVMVFHARMIAAREIHDSAMATGTNTAAYYIAKWVDESGERPRATFIKNGDESKKRYLVLIDQVPVYAGDEFAVAIEAMRRPFKDVFNPPPSPHPHPHLRLVGGAPATPRV